MGFCLKYLGLQTGFVPIKNISTFFIYSANWIKVRTRFRNAKPSYSVFHIHGTHDAKLSGGRGIPPRKIPPRKVPPGKFHPWTIPPMEITMEIQKSNYLKHENGMSILLFKI